MRICAWWSKRSSIEVLRGVGSRREGCFLARGDAVEKVHGALRMGSGGEDRALVLAEDLEPMRQVGGVVLTRFGRDAEIGA